MDGILYFIIRPREGTANIMTDMRLGLWGLMYFKSFSGQIEEVSW